MSVRRDDEPVTRGVMTLEQFRSLPPLTEEEQRRWFEVLEQLDRRRAELLAERGGVLFPNSWEEFPDPGDEIYDEVPEEAQHGEPA